jgi:hypothetical protein
VPDDGLVKLKLVVHEVTVKFKLCDWWFSFFPCYKPGIDPRSSSYEEFIKRTCRLKSTYDKKLILITQSCRIKEMYEKKTELNI